MTFGSFIKKYYGVIMRVFAGVALAALTAAFIFAFKSGWLPYSEAGDAFDTIYADALVKNALHFPRF